MAQLQEDQALASKNCGKIKDYWIDQGYPAIKAWHETVMVPITPRESKAIVLIRSNIGPLGYPPR